MRLDSAIRETVQGRIYIGCPYSDELESVRHWRFVQVTRAAEYMLTRGLPTMSPISYSHQFAHIGGCDFEAWRELDLSLLGRWATELWVLMLPGWEQSVGLAAEIEYADEAGIPVRYIDWSPDALPWAESDGE